MSLRRDKIDTLDGIRISSGIVGEALARSMQDDSDPFTAVSNYRQSVEQALEYFDERMCLIMNDIGDRTMWADRMRSCHKMMRIITMNLAVWGKPEYSWAEVGEAMGFLRAVTQGAESTLSLNEPVPTENVPES